LETDPFGEKKALPTIEGSCEQNEIELEVTNADEMSAVQRMKLWSEGISNLPTICEQET